MRTSKEWIAHFSHSRTKKRVDWNLHPEITPIEKKISSPVRCKRGNWAKLRMVVT